MRTRTCATVFTSHWDRRDLYRRTFAGRQRRCLLRDKLLPRLAVASRCPDPPVSHYVSWIVKEFHRRSILPFLLVIPSRSKCVLAFFLLISSLIFLSSGTGRVGVGVNPSCAIHPSNAQVSFFFFLYRKRITVQPPLLLLLILANSIYVFLVYRISFPFFISPFDSSAPRQFQGGH